MKAILTFITLIFITSSVHATCALVNPTLTAIDNGTGDFVFELSFDNSQGYTLDNIDWDFDDNTPIVSNTSQSMPHQYYYTAASVYDVVATCTFVNGGTTLNCTVNVQVSVPSELPTINCPVATFDHVEAINWCHTGELTLDWSFCNLDYDGDYYPDSYWTSSMVIWNMGDGTSFTSIGNAGITHTYNTSNPQTITATAFFNGENGETCSTELMYMSMSADSACELANDPTNMATPFLTVNPYFAAADFYFDAPYICQGENFQIFNNPLIVPTPSNYASWSYELFLDGASVATGSGMPNNSSPIYQDALNSGDYNFELVYTYESPAETSCSTSLSKVLTIDSCEAACDNCSSFKPYANERYWLSAWVKEEHASQVLSYNDAHINLGFTGANTDIDFYPEGDIIEGWQRIVGSFTIPANTSALDIDLINSNGSINAFFDDIRIHPFNASMKSYVYDPETFWLTAELDDNNYATFYEYDKEGQLIRIKKETARGIMTIQESRSNNPKSEE